MLVSRIVWERSRLGWLNLAQASMIAVVLARLQTALKTVVMNIHINSFSMQCNFFVDTEFVIWGKISAVAVAVLTFELWQGLPLELLWEAGSWSQPMMIQLDSIQFNDDQFGLPMYFCIHKIGKDFTLKPVGHQSTNWTARLALIDAIAAFTSWISSQDVLDFFESFVVLLVLMYQGSCCP